MSSLKVVSNEELNAQFLKVGLHVMDEVLDICNEICQRQKIDEATLVDAWVAFSMTVLSSSVPPSPDKLIIFEKKEFGDPIFSTPKQAKISNVFSKKDCRIVTPVLASTPKRGIEQVYDSEQTGSPIAQVFSVNNSISPTSSRRVSRPSTSSERPVSPDFQRMSSASKDCYSSGQSILTFGSETKWLPSDFKASVSFLRSEFCVSWKLMLDILVKSHNNREDFCESLVAQLLETNNLPEPASFENLPVENTLYVGKIVQDDERLEPHCLTVEGVGHNSKYTIDVDASCINNYSFFPGQIIAFRGVSRGSSKIIATHLYTNGKGPTPSPPKIPEPIQIMVAAGPFTPLNVPDFTIFRAVIEHAKQIKPTVLFLLGPLIDCGAGSYGGRNKLFTQHTYRENHDRILREMLQSFDGLTTKVFYVTSSKDMSTIPVYPTPVELNNMSECTMLPDPSLLTINGVIIGLCTVDIILYLAQQEVSNCRGNRIGRLGGHLLNQQSFYPLENGPLDTLSVDYERLWNYAKIPVVPHILVLPSGLGYYVKDIGECIAVNPEKCIKGRQGNNFSVIEVRKQEDGEEWSPSTHISVKIVRI